MALDLPGIGQESTTRRVHPSHDLAAGVLGFTDYEGRGQGRASSWPCRSVLTGTRRPHRRAVRRCGPRHPDRLRDVRGTGRRQGRAAHARPRPAVVRAEPHRRSRSPRTQANNGTAVVMDVQDRRGARAGHRAHLRPGPPARPGQTMGNPAISDVFEPGSVNKVITAAAALQAGIVTPQTVHRGAADATRWRTRCCTTPRSTALEHLTFAGVLAKSSNIGTVKVAQQVGPQRLYDMMRSFGFGEQQRPRAARREPRPAARAGGLVGDLHRQHPDRPGRVGERASRSRRSTRRSPTAASGSRPAS